MSDKFKIVINDNDKFINIPIELKWDFYGRDDSIEEYQTEVIKEVVGIPDDFEVFRFEHDVYGNNEKTELTYTFNFFSGNSTTITASTVNSSYWTDTYLLEDLTKEEVYFKLKPFSKSFFKLDFYDTIDESNQSIHFTVILNTTKGNVQTVQLSNAIGDVKINKPSFTLDYLKDREGFFLYWLRKRDFVNIDTFYMTAKFFNASKGYWVKMMTKPQSSMGNKFQFESKYFYNKVKLDYVNRTYKIFDVDNNRIGQGTPISWYEYVNP